MRVEVGVTYNWQKPKPNLRMTVQGRIAKASQVQEVTTRPMRQLLQQGAQTWLSMAMSQLKKRPMAN